MTRDAGPFVKQEAFIVAMCRALNDLDDISLNNPFQRTLAYANLPAEFRNATDLANYDDRALERQKLYRTRIKDVGRD